MPQIIAVDYHVERRARVPEGLVSWYASFKEEDALRLSEVIDSPVLAFIHLGNGEIYEGNPPVLVRLIGRIVNLGGRVVCYTGGEVSGDVSRLIATAHGATPSGTRVRILQYDEVWSQDDDQRCDFVGKLGVLKKLKDFEEGWSVRELFARDSALLILYLLVVGFMRLTLDARDVANQGVAMLLKEERRTAKGWWKPLLQLKRGGGRLADVLRNELAERGAGNSAQWQTIEILAQGIETFLLRGGSPPTSDDIRSAELALREAVYSKG